MIIGMGLMITILIREELAIKKSLFIIKPPVTSVK
jgi:hypothetical protein